MKFNTEQKGRIPPEVVDYLLQEGKHTPSRHKRAHVNDRKKGYKMQPYLREKCLRELGVNKEDIKIDMFASLADAQENIFMTEKNSAWRYDWGKLSNEAGVLWVNPPFVDLVKVVTKACLEPCRMVVVAPEWKSLADWKKMAEKVWVAKKELPEFQPIYERNANTQLLPGMHWMT